jgi:hypothetical protein
VRWLILKPTQFLHQSASGSPDRVYEKVLDRAILVVGDRLLDSAISAVPDWWGCFTPSQPAAG